MATTMKVRKGDLVQILSGKDRGKQGRVIDARPAERRVIVENLNVVKRHTKPRPMRDANRMGGTTMMPGGMRFAYVSAEQSGVPYIEIAHIPPEIRAFFDYVKQEQG